MESNPTSIEKSRTKALVMLYLAIALSFFAIGPSISRSNWINSSDFHSCIEIISSFIAIVAGIACLVYFFGSKNRFFLIVGLGFFICGSEDLVHGIFSYERIFAGSGVDFSRYIPGTYVAGRITLAILTILALLSERPIKGERNLKFEAISYTSIAVLLGGGLTALALNINLPQFIFPNRLISRPIDSFSAVLFLIACPLIVKRYLVNKDIFSGMLFASVLFSLGGQIYMSFSKHLYDAFFDVAHFANVFSYLMPVLGISLQGLEEMKKANRELAERQRAEEALQKTNNELIKASHKAGMAEVASDILHNVGNILNSINISVRFIEDRVFNSKAANLKKVTDLIDEHADDLVTFLTKDQRGKHIPVYLTEAARLLADEHAEITKKIRTLTQNVEHIEQVIKAQQGYARVGGVEILADINEVIEDAIKINDAGLRRHDIGLRRELAKLPAFHMDKQRVLQILVNLISNGKYALSTNHKKDKILTIRSYKHEENRLRIEIRDNGIGIPKENFARIFTHGFTTKKDGHGFGLHSSALAAQAMGGSLTVHSDGPGQGATFTLEIPLKLSKTMR